MLCGNHCKSTDLSIFTNKSNCYSLRSQWFLQLIAKVWFLFLDVFPLSPLKHFDSRCTIHSCFEIGQKPAVVSCLTNIVTPPPITQESCSSPQMDRASLLVCTRKKFFWLGWQIFCEWCYKFSSFSAILAHVIWPRAQPLVQSISLKFSLETRFESFKHLIDFLACLVQKLWSKINKLIYYLVN